VRKRKFSYECTSRYDESSLADTILVILSYILVC